MIPAMNLNSSDTALRDLFDTQHRASRQHMDVPLALRRDRLLRVRRLSDAGVSLERIRQVMAGGASPVDSRERQAGDIAVRSHVYIAPGVELQIDPLEAGVSPEQLHVFLRAVMTGWEHRHAQ